MIINFACEETGKIFKGEMSFSLDHSMQNVARRKLEYLHRARTLQDLKSPPGNCLEALKGKWGGRHSIRINDQWRICFRWVDGNAEDVEIVDYHG
ncbi:MAG: type II toxin-antitoxin system RelE/ParE family toxin [Verrucomicrobiota bacterium]